MQSLYCITINNEQGNATRHCIVADTLTIAIAEARDRAGVDETVEPSSTQRMEYVDLIVPSV